MCAMSVENKAKDPIQEAASIVGRTVARNFGIDINDYDTWIIGDYSQNFAKQVLPYAVDSFLSIEDIYEKEDEAKRGIDEHASKGQWQEAYYASQVAEVYRKQRIFQQKILRILGGDPTYENGYRGEDYAKLKEFIRLLDKTPFLIQLTNKNDDYLHLNDFMFNNFKDTICGLD